MDSIERRIADAKLGAAIDDAADGMPNGFRLEVIIQNGCFDVSVTDRRSDELRFAMIAMAEPLNICGGRSTLPECIRMGLAWAIEQDRKGDE